MEKQKRQSGIEVARIIAMLMILVGHYAIHSGFDLSVPPTSWVSVEGFNHILLSSLKYGGFGVSIFVIIAGYCGIYASFKFRKVIKLMAQVLFYSVGIYVICLLTGLVDFQLLDCIKNVFPILFQQYWFVTVYIILYLLSPYLNKLLKGLERKELQKLLAVMVVLWCVIPTFTMQSMYGREVPKFVMLYTIGAYIRLYPDNILSKPKVAKLGLAASLILLFLSSLALQLLGKVSTFFSSHYAVFYDSDTVLVVVGATCLVWLCAHLNLGANKVINKVASATLGVFLIHAHSGWRYRIWKDLFHAKAYENSPYLLLHLILCVAIVYVVCTVLDWLRQDFIEKPFMKLVNRLCEAWEIRQKNKLKSSDKETIL